MMVTFVSQCEKKALQRTRQVLDSFADRSGDSTWQAVVAREEQPDSFRAPRRDPRQSREIRRGNRSGSEGLGCLYRRGRRG